MTDSILTQSPIDFNQLDNAGQAIALAGLGWYVFPCREKPGEPYYSKKDKTWVTPQPKEPYWHKDDLPNGKDNATCDLGQITVWWDRWPDALIGIYCEKSGLFAVDIDCKDDRNGMQSWENLVETYGDARPVEAGPAQQTPSGGYHILFKLPQNVTIPNNSDKLAPGLDLRSNGYICSAGPYSWLPGHDPETRLTDAPAWLLELIRGLTTRASEPKAEGQRTNRATATTDDAGGYWLKRALGQAVPGNRNERGFWLACQLRDAGLSQSEAEDIAREYSSKAPGEGYTEREALASVREAYKPQRRRQPARSLSLRMATVNGNGYHRIEDESPVVDFDPSDAPPPPEPPEDFEALPPAESAPATEDSNLSFSLIKQALDKGESGDADLLAELYAGRLAYDHTASQWYFFTGHHWEPDKRGAVYRLVTNRIAPQYLLAAAEAQTADNAELAKEFTKRAAALRNRKRADNVLFLAARHPRLAVAGDEWDTNPMILGVENGVIELATGDFRPGRPDDYILSYAPTEWRGLNCPAPRWERFMLEISNGNEGLVNFKQRLWGYGISGLAVESALPILYGPDGRNGKTTELETLGAVLGSDLATSSQADALMDIRSNDDGPRPFVYALRGKRLVWASESSEGRRINAGLIKQLTGSDTITVRTLHSKPVSFKPTHLIALITNHKPHVPPDDQAIWDRVHLIEYGVRFVDSPAQTNERKRDKNLRTTLAQEAPGILAWLVRGFLAWQSEGLNPPEALQKATQEYREEEDVMAIYISERLYRSPEARVKASSAYMDYTAWAKENGMQPMSSTAFGRRMAKRFDRTNTATRYYLGVGLLTDEKP